MARHNSVGKWGEELACARLRHEGYAIMEQNWRSGHNEIDIVAVKDGRVVFAEVKTRSDRQCDPLEAIDDNKIRRLARAADSYIRTHGLRHEPQFDIFGIAGTPEDYNLVHIADAFYPPLQTYK